MLFYGRLSIESHGWEPGIMVKCMHQSAIASATETPQIRTDRALWVNNSLDAAFQQWWGHTLKTYRNWCQWKIILKCLKSHQQYPWGSWGVGLMMRAHSINHKWYERGQTPSKAKRFLFFFYAKAKDSQLLLQTDTQRRWGWGWPWPSSWASSPRNPNK